ncbi:MAG TPA: transcriptional repressor [Clostridiaceae bacterium]|nr:transcriptional repressor [Clostridiaceae bacterium]
MNEKFSMILNSKNIKPSYQRIKILEYLACNPCHPCADKIFNEMQKEIPTISKSTVYSTLKTFVAAGILREITIEDSKVRYEYNTKDHGHFKCEVCGNIYDFNINIDNVYSDELKGFKIKQKDVFFRGICNKCLEKSK